MPVIKPRKRLVYFRVSEDEFQQFSQMCTSAGARSISDLARVAVQRMIHTGDGNQAAGADKVKSLEEAVTELNQRLRQLTDLLEVAGSERRPAGFQNQESL